MGMAQNVFSLAGAAYREAKKITEFRLSVVVIIQN